MTTPAAQDTRSASATSWASHVTTAAEEANNAAIPAEILALKEQTDAEAAKTMAELAPPPIPVVPFDRDAYEDVPPPDSTVGTATSHNAPALSSPSNDTVVDMHVEDDGMDDKDDGNSMSPSSWLDDGGSDFGYGDRTDASSEASSSMTDMDLAPLMRDLHWDDTDASSFQSDGAFSAADDSSADENDNDDDMMVAATIPRRRASVTRSSTGPPGFLSAAATRGRDV